MFVRRSLKLRDGSGGLAQPLISHETLLDCGRAEGVLALARMQAAALLRQIEAQRDTLLEEAQRQFWQRAGAQLGQWEQQRQQMWRMLEEQARILVNQALRRLLDDTPPPRRLNALLNQLARSQTEPVSAVLRCHPSVEETVQQWLDLLGESPWRLCPDESLPPDELRLVTEQGDFCIDWRTASDALLLPEDQEGLAEASGRAVKDSATSTAVSAFPVYMEPFAAPRPQRGNP